MTFTQYYLEISEISTEKFLVVGISDHESRINKFSHFCPYSKNQVFQRYVQGMHCWEASRAVWQGEGKKVCSSAWIDTFISNMTSFHTLLWKINVFLKIHRIFLKVLLGVFPQAKSEVYEIFKDFKVYVDKWEEYKCIKY